MKWLNLDVENFSAKPDISLAPVGIVGTWVKVSAYCADKENSGKICGAAKWTDARWQKMVGVTLSDVQSAAPLVRIRGKHVVVSYYPLKQEKRAKFLRSIGGIRHENASDSPNTNGTPEHMLEHKDGQQLQQEPEHRPSTRSPKARAHAPPDAQAHAPPSGEHKPSLIHKKVRSKNEKRKGVCAPSGHRAGADTRGPPAVRSGIPSVEEAWSYAQEEKLGLTQAHIKFWHDGHSAKGWRTVTKGRELLIWDWKAQLRGDALWIPNAFDRLTSSEPGPGNRKNGASPDSSFMDELAEEAEEPNET